MPVTITKISEDSQNASKYIIQKKCYGDVVTLILCVSAPRAYVHPSGMLVHVCAFLVGAQHGIIVADAAMVPAT